MAKKKNSYKWLDLIGVVCGIVALAMIFLPAIGIKAVGDEVSEYSGLQVVFGYTEVSNLLVTTAETEIFKFSFMNLLTYILIIAAVVFLILNILGNGGKFAPFIALGCFVVAAIFAFSAVNFAVAGEVAQVLGKTVKAWDIENLSLLIGPILTAIFSIVGAGSCVAKFFVK